MTEVITETIIENSDGRAVTRLSEFWAGFRATIPLIIGAIPFGMIFGALAMTQGISPAGASAMSAFVFAGSAQFIAAGLVASGASTAIIVLTTFIVNLRHSLYSASLAPHMKTLPHRWLLPLAFWLTDETYVVVINRYNAPDASPYKQWFFLGSALPMYLNWQLCTYIGIRAGQAIHNPGRWGLDFAMVVTFTGMLVPMLRNRAIVICVAIAGITSILFYGLPNKLGLILAALLAVTAGVAVEWWQRTDKTHDKGFSAHDPT
ncbi:MAG: AzlC family ABC transporter permease [Chloroflexi bacterium]|nr:AzlC family ABC transporter permease [Chloroflexota bacterium]